MDINSVFDDEWTLYLHLAKDTDWSSSSYKIINKVKDIKSLFSLFNSIPYTFSEKGMLFFMKNDIKPIWEDEHNRNGGCFSFKLESNNIHDDYKKLVYSIITNTFTTNRDFLKHVNGITISPKRQFNIVKIWLDYKEFTNIKDIEIDPVVLGILDIENCIFKEHNPEF